VRIKDTQLPAAKVSNPNFAKKSRNSPDISKGISQSGMYKFESSQVSQAFRVLENFLLWMRKARQMRAFLIANSLWRPMFELFGPNIPKSLQPNSGKPPFSGDSLWRPKNKTTAC
jgi:hypothetical protein